MNSSTITTTPDQSDKAQQLIELGLAMDPEARSETLARIIAGSIHGGPETALALFAGQGDLDAEEALLELNNLRVPFEHEPWIDALGRHILARGGRS